MVGIRKEIAAVFCGNSRENGVSTIIIYGGVDKFSPDPPPLQRRHLIFHQRDERRDHDCEARKCEGGNLIAEGFARTGRHDAEGVAAGEDRGDDFFLAGAEGVVAEIGLQVLIDGVHMQASVLKMGMKLSY